MLPSEENGPGIETPKTLSAPRASTAIAATTAESIPAAEADQHFLEATFADVILRPGYQRAVGIRNFFMRLLMNLSFSRDGIEEDQILLECQRLCGDLALRSQRHAGTVEDQAIIAAHLVDVNHRPMLIHGNRLKHFKAQGTLIDGVRRSGNIEQAP